MRLRSPLRIQILLPVLLLAVCMAQASSSVCGAQCVAHQVPEDSAHSMAHCHSMMTMQPQAADVQTCPSAAHSFCSVDLLPGAQAPSSVPPAFSGLHTGTLPGPRAASFTRSSSCLRSSRGSSLLTSTFRV